VKRQKTIEDPALVDRGPGHTYDRSVACDNARVQYGDTYNVSYHRAAEEPKEDGWPQTMTVLRFPQMGVRRQTVRDAHKGTCEWIFGEPEYKSWCDTEQTPLHHGFLWVKSKPGAGKSTLMKFLLESTEQQSTQAEAVISFFFNARGDMMERSLEGMYRQLLHQLLTKVARLQSVVSASEVSDLEPLGWPCQLLENMFKRCVLGLGQERVTCFIDALDECPESEIRDLVEFFEDLGGYTTAKGICFRVCFSSRHYPNVSLERCQHFMLDGRSGHQQDIATYIDSKLRLSTTKMNEEIKTDFRNRAQGVFLWVVLVVKRLNQDVDRGNVHNLRSRLDEVPDGLDALFHDTLRLTGDDEGTLIQMMQWMMYARGTLTLKELYFGVHTRTLAEGDLEPWDRDEITLEMMDRFVTNCSRGLVESTKELYPRMQFIHESVRDYLFGGGLELLAPSVSGKLAGASHEYLKHSCLQLLTPRTLNHVPCLGRLLESEDEQAHVDAGYELGKQFPLLSYAFIHTVHHAERAARYGVDQLDFVVSFPLRTWNEIRVLMGRKTAMSKTEVFARDGCYELLKYELRPNYPLLSPREHMTVLYKVIRHGTPQILELVLKRGVLANICDDDQVSLISSAIYWQDQRKLEILFESGLRLHTDRMFRRLLSHGLLLRNAAIVQTLLDHESQCGPFTDNALHNAVNRGSIASVRALLDSGADFNARTMQFGIASGNPDASEHHSFICGYPGNGVCYAAMKIVDSSGAAVQDAQIAEELTALHYAALTGRTEMVELLLAQEAKRRHMPCQDYIFARPMYLAALLGHQAIVVRFLEDPSWLASLHTTVWHESLHAAVMNGHTEIVKVLLADAVGAKSRRLRQVYYQDVIKLTASRGHGETLMMLLDAPHFRPPTRCCFGLCDETRARCVREVTSRERRSAREGQTGRHENATRQVVYLSLALEEKRNLKAYESAGWLRSLIST